jgi:transcriptional regulator with XRE-family HTH domain
MSHPAKVRERFLNLRAQGWSFSRIAAELNVSPRTLLRWQSRYSGTISQRAFFDCQEIIDRNHLSKRAQIEKFAALIDKIDTTLAQRDMSKESLRELINLRKEFKERLWFLTCDYHIYAGRNPDPDNNDEYEQGLIGVQ